jgi:hypothetical protein
MLKETSEHEDVETKSSPSTDDQVTSDHSDDDTSTHETSTATTTATTATMMDRKPIDEPSNSDSSIPNIDVDNLVSVTTSMLDSIIYDLCEYIGTRNIYVELYDQLFGSLYHPIVKDRYVLRFHQLTINSTFSPLLSRYFDPCLTSCCDLAPDATTVNLVIKAMFRKTMRTLYTVILDGDRTIFSHDSITLLLDLEAIEKFFCEAIKQEYIHHYTLKLKCIIAAVMDKPTKELIEGGKCCPMYHQLPDKKPEINGSPWTKLVVWKVINCRRKADSLAKKFIKNNPYRFDLNL